MLSERERLWFLAADPAEDFWRAFAAIEDECEALVFLLRRSQELPRLSETRHIIARALAQAAASLDPGQG